jgi:hypothetical protein
MNPIIQPPTEFKETLIQSPIEFKEETKYHIRFTMLYDIYDKINDKMRCYIEYNRKLRERNVHYYYLGKDINNNNKTYYIFIRIDLSEYLYLFKCDKFEFKFNAITDNNSTSYFNEFDGQREKKCIIYNINEESTESTEYILK